MKNYARFRQFIAAFTRLIDEAGNDESAILAPAAAGKNRPRMNAGG